ncbi:TldD/PmbA family protein [Jidongwangia harbinensis]|uniref:TldD/PmbA family protein n=1 Tax=Jidongwangia harbinensis TaxID=2878561 RepID=UPI001CDA0DAE|nr:metallopeptidase TldD-related protein [Jidongwangia harbinensis]MCA2219575.1 TldD/PmbA family protein [Jidongwangia harbinensis]
MTELALAGRVVELVREWAGPHAEAEVGVHHSALALTRFANSAIHQNVDSTVTTVSLRLHLDGRTAGGSTTVVDADGLRSLVDRTVAAARLSPPDTGWAGLLAPTPLSHPDTGFDEATAQATPEDRALRVREFVRAADGLETAGFCRTHRASAAFANSAGQAVAGRAVEAAMDGIARADGADGVARLAASRLADLDGAALGRRAAGKALAGRHPVELPPGQYEVVLEPTAVADLLANLASFAFNGRDSAQGRSFVELGAAQFDPAVTIVDDPVGTFPGAAATLPFDDEGTPRAPLTLVRDGVSTAVTHDRTSAAAAGATSTGHASPSSRSTGPTATHLRLLPGPAPTGPAGAPDGPAVPSARPLVAAMARGLLVTDLWYTRVLDQKSLAITGLTRNGVWLVEDGEVVAAVSNMRFTQSYRQALAAGTVRGIGAEAVPLPDRWAGHQYAAPALHLAGWNLTGNASG